MGCGGSKEEEPKFTAFTAEIKTDAASKSGGEATTMDETGRKFSQRKRRRVAVASENSEMLASVRWQSAFDALRKDEFKLPQHVLKIKETMASNAIFGGMEPSVIDQVVNAMRVIKVKAGDVVINKGDAGDSYYVVVEGSFEVFLVEADGVAGQKAVKTYGPGDTFGELALLYDAPRAATVKATSEALVFKLGRIHFRNLIQTQVAKTKDHLEVRLAKVPVLAGLSADQINHLAEAMEPVSFSDGEYIEEMGAVADCLYVLLSGEVACHRSDGQELRLSDGAIFGETALSEPADGSENKRQANVVAVGTVRCARLKAADAQEILGPLQMAIEHAFTRKVLSSVELFASLDTRQMSELISKMVHRKLAPGEKAIEEGEMGKAFYVIRSGACDVTVAAAGKVKSLTNGDWFGERSIMSEEPTNATIVATEATDLIGLTKADFEALLGPLQKIIEKETARREEELRRKTKVKYLWNDLDPRQVLGEGSFGVVRITVHKPTNKAFALKALHKGHLISTNQIKNTINEKTIMRTCDHPLILQCFATFNQKTHINLLLGLALGGELFTRLQKVERLKPKDASMYVAMVASALGFLSERHIAHRDLKLENLLIDDVGYLKLVDFGFAKAIEQRSWTFCGTPDYLAPEILAHKGHNYAVDWWALGVLTYEMLHGEPPFMEDDQMRTFARITANDYKMRITDRICIDLIQRMLVLNPSKRYGMLANREKDITRHPLCADIDIGKLLAKELIPPFVPNLSNPLDTSNFDDFGTPSSGKKFNKYLDAKYDETWEREFGESSN